MVITNMWVPGMPSIASGVGAEAMRTGYTLSYGLLRDVMTTQAPDQLASQRFSATGSYGATSTSMA